MKNEFGELLQHARQCCDPLDDPEMDRAIKSAALAFTREQATKAALIAAVEYMLPRAHRHLCDEAELTKIRATLKEARGFEPSAVVVGADVKAAFAGRGKS